MSENDRDVLMKCAFIFVQGLLTGVCITVGVALLTGG